MRKRFRSDGAYPGIVRVRIYVLRALALRSSGECNPYLTFTFGQKIESLRGSAKEKTTAPHFFWVHEADVSFPGEGRCEIGVASRAASELGKDTWIGSTVVELEDRWFSKEWRIMMNNGKVPLEYRKLKQSKDSANTVGTLEMWIEMLDLADEAEFPRTELKPPLPTELELRLVMWGARSLSFANLGKESVDAKIKCTLDCSSYKGKQPVMQETDIHYNSRNGNAVFNWRFVFSKIVLPVTSCNLQVAAYDHKNVGADVFIGEVNLELRRYLERLGQTLSRKEVDAELKLFNRANKSAAGFVQLTVQMLSMSEAQSAQVGLGREDPNRNPRLPQPEDGRSWDDFLSSAGAKADMGAMWFWVRLATCSCAALVLFILCFLYPALFWL
eukprot:Selendium_serpulae@DN3452_c0_g1_i1.p1